MKLSISWRNNINFSDRNAYFYFPYNFNYNHLYLTTFQLDQFDNFKKKKKNTILTMINNHEIKIRRSSCFKVN